MKKNGQRLILFVLGVVLALFLSIFYGPKAKARQKVSLDFNGGYQLVYNVNSSDEAVVKQAAEILNKRILNYGASDSEYAIDGSKITISFTGVEDVEAMRANITRKGELTIRNSDDELVMDASVLNSAAPITLTKNGEDNVIVLNVKDTDTFYEKTANQAAAANKYLVIWVDFREGIDKYSEESSKTDPSYLAAATVSSGIQGSCYITTHHKFEDAFKQVVLAFSGALPAEVSEVSCSEITARHAAFDSVWKAVIIGSLAAGGGLVGLFGLAGCTVMLMMLLNAVAFFGFTALLGIKADSFLLAGYTLSTLIALIITYPVLKEFKLNLLRGRNLQTALDNALANNKRAVWEAVITQIALGGLGMLIFRNALLSSAGAVLIGGICNLLLFVLWNRTMLKDMIGSGYCSNLKLYRVDPAGLPDVEKGESYVEKPCAVSINFGSLLKGNIPYIIFAVSLAALLLVSGHAESGAVWKALLLGCIFIAIAAVYVLFAYKDRYGAMPLMICFDLMVGVLAAVIAGKGFAGIALCGVALSAALLFILIGRCRTDFRRISREKVNEEKLNKFVNTLLNSFTEDYCYPAVMFAVLALAIGIFCGNFKVSAVALLIAVGALVTSVVLASKMWYEAVKKNMDRKPKKGNKKKGKKERSETVIFGLNEVK